MPWGLRALRPQEQQQTTLGGALLRTTLTLLYDAQKLGVSGVWEHPTPPHDTSKVSAFRLQEVTALRRMSEVSYFDFHQCALGASSTKPTSLLLVHAHEVKAQIQQRGNHGLCPHSTGHQHIIGRLDSGGWATAPAKQYPADLCLALAQGIHAAILRRRPDLADQRDACAQASENNTEFDRSTLAMS